MRLVICDDHRLLLEALSSAIAAHGHIVEAATTTPSEALVAVRKYDPDLLLLDLHFGDGDSLDTARDVLAMHSRTKVVILTASDDIEPMRRALDIGVSGFLRKDRGINDIVSQLERSRRGEPTMDEHMLRRLGRVDAVPSQRGAHGLTARELDVAVLLEQGLDTPAIEDQLGISRSTVRSHIQSILAKLSVHSRVQAVALLAEARRPELVRGAVDS
ncbi:MAG TPA: response regulator transcription factor [Nocardioidaceae bacterium]|nr:response regulator transcription factor [Nocardioidaceae bacterium]